MEKVIVEIHDLGDCYELAWEGNNRLEGAVHFDDYREALAAGRDVVESMGRVGYDVDWRPGCDH